MHLDDKTFTNLLIICQALDAKFPHGADIFQRVSRLCEESGELASAVNHRNDELFINSINKMKTFFRKRSKRL